MGSSKVHYQNSIGTVSGHRTPNELPEANVLEDHMYCTKSSRDCQRLFIIFFGKLFLFVVPKGDRGVSWQPQSLSGKRCASEGKRSAILSRKWPNGSR